MNWLNVGLAFTSSSGLESPKVSKGWGAKGELDLDGIRKLTAQMQ
jgi:hypothetical protein